MATIAKEPENYDGSTPLANQRREQFCHEYLIDYNGLQAALRAGYAKKAAKQQASLLLTLKNVSARLAYLMDQKKQRATKKADDIRRELERIAFSNITNTVTWNESGACFVKGSDEMSEDHTAAIEMIEVTESGGGGSKPDSTLNLKTKVKLHDKLKALTLLGKEEGMFVEKVEVSADEEFAKLLTMAIDKANKARNDDG